MIIVGDHLLPLVILVIIHLVLVVQNYHRLRDTGSQIQSPSSAVPNNIHRRRSESPPRSYDQAYPGGGGYSNGYPGSVSTGPSMSGPPRGPPRDYIPSRNGRDPIDSGPGYRRH